MAGFENGGVRLATETQPGQFAVVDSPALTLTVGTSTLSIKDEKQTAVLHLALAACLFGASDARIMVVPKDRGPAHILEFESKSAAMNCRHALLQRNAEVTDAVGSQASQHDVSMEELERLMQAPGFSSFMREAESVLSRRSALRLPEMVPN